MPLQIQEVEGGRVVLVRATGPAEYSEWVELGDRETPDRRRALLADVRDRKSLPSGEEARLEGYLAGCWSAVAIVTRGGAQYGMGRVVAAIAEHQGTPVSVFTDLQDAREWLLGAMV